MLTSPLNWNKEVMENEFPKSTEDLVKIARKVPQKNIVRLSSGLSAQEEAFAQAIVKHSDKIRAVQEAGFLCRTPRLVATKAWKLLKRERVVKRIDALRNATALRNNITSDTVVKMLQDAYTRAMEASKFGDAIRAAELLGDHLDLFKVKPSTVTNVMNVSDTHLMDRELKRLASAAGVKLILDEVIDVTPEAPPLPGDDGDMLRDASHHSTLQEVETPSGGGGSLQNGEEHRA